MQFTSPELSDAATKTGKKELRETPVIFTDLETLLTIALKEIEKQGLSVDYKQDGKVCNQILIIFKKFKGAQLSVVTRQES